MRIGSGENSYEWIEDWAKVPDTPSHRENGRTHGIVVTENGDVVVFCQADPAVLIFDSNGTLTRSWGERFPGAHGMTLVKEGDHEYLWLTDQNTAEVVKTTLEGQTVLSLSKPDLPVYHNGGRFSPTWVAVSEERFGGNGDIWVTDGYGSNYIHRYDREGNYRSSINGEEGQAGAFRCPHGIWMDGRKEEPELYIADRSNRRVQVYDMDGSYKRVFGSDFLSSPCGFVTQGEQMFIPELRARLAVLDREDNLVCYLGQNESVCDIAGWPNHPKELIQPGKFNSPHGMAADSHGSLYIAEWIVGGRITKLATV